MSEIVEFKDAIKRLQKKKKEEELSRQIAVIEELKTIDLEAVIAANNKKKERLVKERERANASVIRSHRLKKPAPN